jgi:hypothetical protein
VASTTIELIKKQIQGYLKDRKAFDYSTAVKVFKQAVAYKALIDTSVTNSILKGLQYKL